MKFYVSAAAFLAILILQGCGSPESGSTPPADSTPAASSPPAEAAAVESAASEADWFETIEDPKSASVIYKSPADDRQYRYQVLDNGLKVLMISDPEADKAAASLSIDVGSFENPKEREGLAHFLEHMLFLGTDKFPEPGEYQAFLTEHGGTFNAYTSLEETNYFFDIDPKFLVQTLDRFSRFFVKPLFNEGYVDRERHAVDSEYQLKIKDDSRREWDVLRELTNPAHPFSLFSVGSLKTLENSEEAPVREDLIAFYQKYYTASRMDLVVLGNETLDELNKIVIDRFSEIPSHKVELKEQYTPLFASPLPLKVTIEPIKEMRTLSFNFPMPSLERDWRIKPAGFIGHLLGHEGEGSLLSVLKDSGLAEGLSSGLVFDSRHGALFSVSIALTPSGVEQQQLVTSNFFQWLQMVRESGLESWRYDEVAKMSQVGFQFQGKRNPMSYVSQLSTALHQYTPEEILRGDYLYAKFDEPRLTELMDYLVPSNVAVVLTAPGVKTDRKTALYDAPYAVEAVDVADLKAADVVDGLKLPAVNPYIPNNLELVTESQGQKAPELLEVDAGTMSWFMGTNPFESPKAFFEARIAIPEAEDLASVAATEFILALVRDELSSEVYPAMLAGLNFSLNPWANGYKISVVGFDEKQPVLLERILSVLKNPDWKEARVERVRQSMLRSWRNTSKDWPLRQLFARLPTLMENDWLPPQKADQLEQLTIQQLKAIHSQLIGSGSGRFYGVGNMTSANMLEMINQTKSALALDPAKASPAVNILDLKAAQALFASNFYVDHNDSSAVLYLQGESDNLDERATFALLEVMASAPFYNALRTEKQLGYAVGSSIAPLLRVPGMMFYVQSPKVDAASLKTEIDGFFQGMSEKVAALTQEDLDRYRSAVLASIEEKPMNLNDLAQRHLESLNLGYDDFDFRDQLVAAMKAVTLEDFKRSYDRVVLGERAGLWLLTTTDEAVGIGSAVSGDFIEGEFSYSY